MLLKSSCLSNRCCAHHSRLASVHFDPTNEISTHKFRKFLSRPMEEGNSRMRLFDACLQFKIIQIGAVQRPFRMKQGGPPEMLHVLTDSPEESSCRSPQAGSQWHCWTGTCSVVDEHHHWKRQKVQDWTYSRWSLWHPPISGGILPIELLRRDLEGARMRTPQRRSPPDSTGRQRSRSVGRSRCTHRCSRLLSCPIEAGIEDKWLLSQALHRLMGAVP